jgi:triacylglycerol esterase/lipase EstA (alpha/beta hydrolase family)
VFIVSLIILSTVLFIAFSSQLVNAQPICDNQIIQSARNGLPVILIHGYKEAARVWSQWEYRLGQDKIPFCTVSFDFSDDKCGSAMDHAREMNGIIEEVKSITSIDQVNIAAHSKGGLDSRAYLGNTTDDDVYIKF